MRFGFAQLKAKTPVLMRALGTALGAGATLLAGKEFAYGNINGAIIAGGVAMAGKFLTELFGEKTVLEGTIDGVAVKVTEPAPPPTLPELQVEVQSPASTEAQ
jgi:hypothetical protein